MNVPFKKHSGYDPLGDCGKGKCPICARNQAISRLKNEITSTDFSTDAVSPFVGQYGYPYVNAGIMAPPSQREDSWLYDSPKYWAIHNFAIPRIVDFRSSLINSRYKINVKSTSRILELSQEIGMTSKPVDVDINIKEKPKFRLNLDSQTAPYGPNAALEKIKLSSNPKIHPKVDRAFSDTDLKARDAILQLYNAHFDENFLSRILSVGTVGLKKNRKLVPTRWSITAVDDTLGKDIINEIKNYSEADHQLYQGSYLGNYYFICLFPALWSYELFETYIPSGINEKNLRFMTDYESHQGRSSYAENCAGGYYTVRLAIAEKLREMKRQASALALRIITDEYTAPLGVWVTREAARKAMNSKPLSFASKELTLSFTKQLIQNKFGCKIDPILNHSKLLRYEQKRLSSYI